MSEDTSSLRERINEVITKLTAEKFSVDVEKFDAGVKSAGTKFRKEARALIALLKSSVKFSLGKED